MKRLYPILSLQWALTWNAGLFISASSNILQCSLFSPPSIVPCVTVLHFWPRHPVPQTSSWAFQQQKSPLPKSPSTLLGNRSVLQKNLLCWLQRTARSVPALPPKFGNNVITFTQHYRFCRIITPFLNSETVVLAQLSVSESSQQRTRNR